MLPAAVYPFHLECINEWTGFWLPCTARLVSAKRTENNPARMLTHWKIPDNSVQVALDMCLIKTEVFPPPLGPGGAGTSEFSDAEPHIFGDLLVWLRRTAAPPFLIPNPPAGYPGSPVVKEFRLNGIYGTFPTLTP
ncbi:hypothetical protein [Nocardia brasiliensis]|uniref:hypothetical protein n=1 Tax=Nocardia brasiliensis TaxID=37326 RepID=UPI002454A200|nr:hypothetical protein [Nocardia brasiliensis]